HGRGVPGALPAAAHVDHRAVCTPWEAPHLCYARADDGRCRCRIARAGHCCRVRGVAHGPSGGGAVRHHRARGGVCPYADTSTGARATPYGGLTWKRPTILPHIAFESAFTSSKRTTRAITRTRTSRESGNSGSPAWSSLRSGR